MKRAQLRRPVGARPGRNRAEVERLRRGPFVAGPLDRIGVERGDLGCIHPVRGQPSRDVDVAEPLDVGEDLVAAGAGDRAGGREGIAHQHEARLAACVVLIEIDRADLQLAGNIERTGDALEPGQGGMQRLGWGAAQLAQPGIVEAAIDEQVGAHPRPDREQRDVGDAIARPLREIG